jgi:hypothetical protein
MIGEQLRRAHRMRAPFKRQLCLDASLDAALALVAKEPIRICSRNLNSLLVLSAAS